MTAIGIVGLGLIGGSVALAARDGGHTVTAWDVAKGARAGAMRRGLRVQGDLSGAELVVLAVPMADLTDGLAATLAAVQISDTATITDVGSLKEPVVYAMRSAGLARRFVGGHPLAGTEEHGFGAANPALFAGKRWALCLDDDRSGHDAGDDRADHDTGGGRDTNGADTDLARWLRVAEFATSLGAQVIPVLPSEHDEAMAMVSGLPHLLALALAASARESGPLVAALAAGSFADLIRVAGSDPALLHALTEQNEPAVRAALRQLQDRLSRPWSELIATGHAARKSLLGSTESDRRAGRQAAAADPQELLALGRSGAVIEAVDPSTATVWHRTPAARHFP